MNTVKIILILTIIGLGIVSVWTGLRYHNDLISAQDTANDSQIAETACGNIEYAISGEGAPILVLHGAGGGHDQGVLLGENLLDTGYKIIAPSRFGYLKSPVPHDASLIAQAEAYACLLDALRIDQPIPVLAVSAGGPSGLQFAHDHSERVSALILGAAITYTEAVPAPTNAQTEQIINRMIGSDFLYWLVTRVAFEQATAVFGIPVETQAKLSQADLDLVDTILLGMLPMSQRIDGIQVDQSRQFPKNDLLANINVPTLILHARDDTLISFGHAQYAAENIESAELFTLADGGHFLIGHHEEIQTATKIFISKTETIGTFQTQ